MENEDYETDTSSEDEDIDFEELMATKIALASRENIEKRLESCNEWVKKEFFFRVYSIKVCVLRL